MQEQQIIRLFRPEAKASGYRRVEGEVLLAIAPRTTLFSALAVLSVVALLLFAAIAKYARTESVEGWLVPSGGLMRLTAPRGGVIQHVNVAEGDEVRAGQVLAIVSLSPALQHGDEAANLTASEEAEGAASDAKASAALEALSAEHDQLIRRRSLLEGELSASRRRDALQVEQVKVTEAELKRSEPIAASGYLVQHELEARRLAALGAKQQLASMQVTTSALERDISDVDAQLAAMKAKQETALADAAIARAQQQQQLTKTEAEGTYIIQAPRAGRVAVLSARAGQTIAATGLVMVLTPAASSLEAELYAPSRSSGRLWIGQRVRLDYQAYSHERYGSGSGHILSISTTALAPDDIAMPGLDKSAPIFRVSVGIDPPATSLDGHEIVLEPGMRLAGQVEIERRTLLDWLLRPILPGASDPS